MKQLILVLLLVCVFCSCSKEDINRFNATLGQEIKLKEGQTALYRNSGSEASSGVMLKLERVHDSRCPSDVQCISYGRVDAVLRLSSGEGAGERVTMCLGVCDDGGRSRDSAEVIVRATHYRIILLDVTPLPMLKKKPGEEKVAQLLVEQI